MALSTSNEKGYFCSMKPFTELLLHWYAANGRALPWRQSQDPYRIWISEIILQQTRVAQGMEYYLRFVKRFPDVRSLAEAPDDEVMKYWQGLGYYSRARHLHEAARRMNGTFPRTYAEVRALPGIGDYTAAAICSFAYGMPCAVVDGNVYRVLTRFFGIDLPIDSAKGKQKVEQLANELLCKERPADYNQAIMDFGAIQCTPRSPQCDSCPLSGGCQAFALQSVETFPVKRHKTKVTDRYFHYIYVRAGACTYIHKRTGNDIWKNLYELPMVESEGAWDMTQLLSSPTLAQWLHPGETPQVHVIEPEVRHQLSHRLIHAAFYEMILPEDTLSFSSFLRIPIEHIEEYAVPRLIHAFLEKYL